MLEPVKRYNRWSELISRIDVALYLGIGYSNTPAYSNDDYLPEPEWADADGILTIRFLTRSSLGLRGLTERQRRADRRNAIYECTLRVDAEQAFTYDCRSIPWTRNRREPPTWP